MSWLDWTIVIIPLIVVYALGIYSSRYANSVADFLSAGRLCGRYVIAVGDIANALSIIGLIAYIEVHYRTGFALEFWKQMTLPLGVFMELLYFQFCLPLFAYLYCGADMERIFAVAH